MTLIAAFKVEGVPVVLGDFVLSTLEERSGLRKKTRRLGLNCALAWTGHLIAAEHVFRVLHERLGHEQSIKREALTKALTEFNSSEFGDLNVVLIGWIIDGEQFCFRWRSDWPQEVFYPTAAYDGSGSHMIESLCGQGISDASTPEGIDLDLAIDTSLSIATNLMRMEILYRNNLSDLTFGHAYEILLLQW